MRTMTALALGLAATSAATAAALAVRPRGDAGPADPYFASLDRALKAARVGTPRIVIDLDRVDRNVATILAHLPDPSAYRIVEKSVPSVDLIRYIAERTGSRRIMALHGPFLGVLLDTFDHGIDILLGKPMPRAVED
jgi:D-serine deaminase-like pyridoxal phosphate-dependent protein